MHFLLVSIATYALSRTVQPQYIRNRRIDGQTDRRIDSSCHSRYTA